MTSERLNSWLTLLANVGVVIGLVVVIFEIRESNRQTTSATNVARYSEIESSMRDAAISDHLPEIYVIVEKSGVEELDREQLFRIRSWEMARIIRMEGQYVQFHDGYLPETGYKIMIETAKENLQLWNDLGIQSANSEFRAAIESEGGT